MTQKEGKAIEQPKYKSPYESEVTYKSDKNFVVRLKAMIGAAMLDSGYSISGKKYDQLIEYFDNCDERLFDSSEPSPNQTPSPQPGNGQEWKGKADQYKTWAEQNASTAMDLAERLDKTKEELSQAQEEIKRLTPTTQSAEVLIKALEEIVDTLSAPNFSSHNQMKEAIQGGLEISETALEQFKNNK
jgi:hypothetical protein